MFCVLILNGESDKKGKCRFFKQNDPRCFVDMDLPLSDWQAFSNADIFSFPDLIQKA